MSLAIEGDFRLQSKEGQQLQELLLKRKNDRNKMKEIYGNNKSKKSKEVPDDPLPGTHCHSPTYSLT